MICSHLVALAFSANAGAITVEPTKPAAGVTRVGLMPELVLKIPGLRADSISAETVTLSPAHIPAYGVTIDVSYSP